MSLTQLNELLENAFVDRLPSIELLQNIKTELYKIDVEDRYQYAIFIKDLKSKMFSSGISLPGFDFKDYINKTAKNQKKLPIPNLNVLFSENLTLLINAIKFSLETLKNYFILDLTLEGNQDYNLIIIHDETYFVAPIIKPLEKYFPENVISSLEDLKKITRDLIQSKTNYLVLVLLESKKNDEGKLESCKKYLTDFIKEFDGFSSIALETLIANKFGKYEYKVLNDRAEFIDEVEFVLSSFLTNTRLAYDEEIIIKKLFQDFNCPILEYKLITKGFSGASVIEVKPIKRFSPEKSKRYIVKFDRKISMSKLKKESRLFSDCLGGLEGFSDYTCERTTTKTHEALLYQYAKSDSSQESFSFAQIISDDENVFYTRASKLIEELHEIKPYELWKNTIRNVEITVFEFYEMFVNEKKTISALKRILNVTEDELYKFEIFKIYEKTKGIKINSSVKICHGDLHTNNFFADPSIYLIDFGESREHHSLIDFVTLEASIKFNHFPRYLQSNELESIENVLLDSSTFNASFEFDKTIRPELLYYLGIIHNNRRCCNQYLNIENNFLEYFLALYYMTIKQIRYNDMNQRYALLSMRILGEHIVKLS